MSKAAQDIEWARRRYVECMGTEMEALARAYLEGLVDQARRKSESGPSSDVRENTDE